MYPNNLIRQYNEELNELEMALLKVCITEMHILKSQNQLDGKTVSEEYQFFCEKKSGEEFSPVRECVSFSSYLLYLTTSFSAAIIFPFLSNLISLNPNMST